MRCIGCGSAAVTERPERTAQGYRRFRCRSCGKQFNEHTGTVLNRAQYPSDVIALVVLWRLRYKLSLRDLPEMFLVRGMVFCHETVRVWEAKLTPPPRWPRSCGTAGAARWAAAGTSMRRI
jgi:putative transposase